MKVNTMTLYVHESGDASATTIVFLHGIGTSGWMWEKQIAALTDFHCLNVDLPGHGKSSHVAWDSLADTADRIAEIIQSQATSGKAHIVGLSLGGYIALVLMARHSALVDHVIISAVTDAPMPNRHLLNPQLWMMSILKRRWLVKLQAQALGLSPEMQAAFIENFLRMSMKTYRKIAEEVVDFYLPSALQNINIPMLITAGENESRIIKQTVETIPQFMPKATGRFAPNLKHGWNIQSPDLFSAMIRSWITNTPLPSALKAPSVGIN